MHFSVPRLLFQKPLWQAEASLLILMMLKKLPIHSPPYLSLMDLTCCGSMQQALMTGLITEIMGLHLLATMEHWLLTAAAGKLCQKKRMAKIRWRPYHASKEKMMASHYIQKILLKWYNQERWKTSDALYRLAL